MGDSGSRQNPLAGHLYQWYDTYIDDWQAWYGNILMDNLDTLQSSAAAPPSGTEAARFDVANRLFLRLYQASNLLHKTGTRAVGRYGATTQQWAVLGALSRPAARDRGLTVKQLLAFLMVSRQNLTAVLDRLEAAGLVARSRIAGDGRLRHIRLTPHGAQIWQDMQGSIRAYYEDALTDFSMEEVVQLFRLLDRLRNRLGQIVDPDGD
jgi:DNA-binding MarR family transcriptional regulator